MGRCIMMKGSIDEVELNALKGASMRSIELYWLIKIWVMGYMLVWNKIQTTNWDWVAMILFPTGRFSFIKCMTGKNLIRITIYWRDVYVLLWVVGGGVLYFYLYLPWMVVVVVGHWGVLYIYLFFFTLDIYPFLEGGGGGSIIRLLLIFTLA